MAARVKPAVGWKEHKHEASYRHTQSHTRPDDLRAAGEDRLLGVASVGGLTRPPTGDDIVEASQDASLLEVSTGNCWIKTRRPELYESLTVPTGMEQDTRTVRFDRKGV